VGILADGAMVAYGDSGRKVVTALPVPCRQLNTRSNECGIAHRDILGTNQSERLPCYMRASAPMCEAMLHEKGINLVFNSV